MLRDFWKRLFSLARLGTLPTRKPRRSSGWVSIEVWNARKEKRRAKRKAARLSRKRNYLLGA